MEASAADLKIEPYSDLPATSTPLPFIAGPKDTSWSSGASIWQGKGNGVSGDVWIGASSDGFQFHIVVHAPTRKSDFEGRNLWRGDCVYIALDGRGTYDGHATMPPCFGVFIFGLGSHGPEGRVSAHGDPMQLQRDGNALIQSITRNDADQTTTYNIAIPFDAVSTAMGQAPAIGVAVVIAHKDVDGKDLCWGQVWDAPGTPRQLHRFLVPTAPGNWATIAPRQLTASLPEDPVEVSVALHSSDQATIQAGVGDSSAKYDVTGSDQVQRFVVRIPGGGLDEASSQLHVAVEPMHLAKSFQILTPQIAFERMQTRIAHLLKTAPNALVSRHLSSTLQVTAQAYALLPIEPEEHPGRAVEFMNAVNDVLDKLPPDQTDWKDYTEKCIPLVVTFVSKTDETLQYYALQLPFGYQEGKTYPLTIYLHGYGDPNPLIGMTTAFDNSNQDTLFQTQTIAPDQVPPAHRGFILAPWARGNMYYQGASENDVFQSIQDVEKHFSIDRDRVYMTGFSMGCHGAMALAARQPDLFAGVNLASGFGSWSDTHLDYLQENLRGLPIVMWVGELDPMIDGARPMDQQLTAHGIEHRFITVPNLPHTYPYAEYQKNVGYLMQFTRKPITTFTYTSDSPKHTGRNGITMTFSKTVGELPSFSCKIDGSTVRIDSKNTDGLSVELGPTGLGLSSETVVEVIWNGQSVYHGPAKHLDLGDKVAK